MYLFEIILGPVGYYRDISPINVHMGETPLACDAIHPF